MIVVDTSALMAVLLDEPHSKMILEDMVVADQILMSAATLAEALIVANSRNIGSEMQSLIEELAIEIVPVTAQVAKQVAQVYTQWGKGIHPAGLNFCDCFSYQAAKELDCRLVFVGNDFSKTDLVRSH